MRLRRLLPLFAIPLVLSACENPAGRTASAEIEGVWVRVHDPIFTVHSEDRLVFGPGDRYVRRLIIYDAAASGEVSAIHVAQGQFRLRGERLELRITRVTDWDGHRGMLVSTPGRGWEDAGTIQITGRKMVRTVVTYPADAPVSTTLTYVRPGLD